MNEEVTDVPATATRRPLFGSLNRLGELPTGSPTGKRAFEILMAEQLSEMRAIHSTTTEYWARLAGMITNDVLDVGSQLFTGSALFVSKNFKTAIGCIVVDNQGSNVMYVNGSMLSITAAGPQVTPVPAGAQRLVNLAAHAFTIVGTAGDTVAWQAFTRGAIPASTVGSINGGTP